MVRNTIYDGSKMPHFPTLSSDAECGVLVIGGGICGLMCAYYLARSGTDVLLVEADTVASQVTARSTAVVSVGQDILARDVARRMGDEAAALVIRSRLDAISEYRGLVRELGAHYDVGDFYLYSTGGASAIEREYEKMKRYGADASLVRGLPINVGAVCGIRFPASLMLDPLEFSSLLAGKLNIFEHTRAIRLTSFGAETDRFRISADKVIVATHFPLPKLRGLYALKLYQESSYVLVLDGVRNIGGAYEDIAEDGVFLRMYGDLLLLGGGTHRTGRRGGGFAPLLDYRAKHFRNSRLISSFRTQDITTLDNLPYIGKLARGNDRFYVATGFGGYGFIGSMLSATILRDLITSGSSTYSELYSPSRNIFCGRLFSNIGAALGNYLIPTTRRCPHLGCALVWNSAECTWDCPCHGSRFDKCGELLNGPAKHGAQRK